MKRLIIALTFIHSFLGAQERPLVPDSPQPAAGAPFKQGGTAIKKYSRTPISSGSKKSASKQRLVKELPDGDINEEPTTGIPETQKLSRRSAALPFQNDALHKKTKALVEQGIEFFKNNSLEVTCYTFTRTNKFLQGDISLFLLDINGNYLASGENEPYILWKNIANASDDKIVRIEDLFELARNNNGWLNYGWRNATKVVYVQVVTKDKKEYILGGTYYSFSQADNVVNLVRSAVDDFEKKKAEGKAVADAFSDMSYPLGKFTNGNLYLFAYDFDGNTMAHGNDPTSIGTNELDLQDKNGKYIHREIIEKLKNTPDQGVWTDYIYFRAPKHSYSERVVGTDGTQYFIGSGYYPDADQKALVDLVERGYDYLKTVGKTQAAAAFTTKENDDFRYGDIYLFVYDMHGNCIANGKDPVAVGRNYYNAKDDQGNYYVKTFIERATATGAWINLANKNSIESVYVKTITIGTEKFVIGAGIYPSSKEETMILLTKSASSYLQTNIPANVFAAITEYNGKFIRGNLEVFVFDPQGFCLVYGDNLNMIWQNFLDSKDDDGRPYVKIMINGALSGPTRIKYRLDGFAKEAYVQSVKQDGKSYIVGSSRFLMNA